MFRFCGTTSLFCTGDAGKPCQSNCDAVKRPSCSANSGQAQRLSVGYYESWAYNRPCDALAPEQIQASAWTHLNYAFALINPSTFKMSQMNDFDVQLYPKFTGLKASNPGLKTYIAVGGWAAGGKVFSDMVSSAANRKAFINSALQFVRTYSFDGIDIDWEYPSATDRQGVESDLANFTTFMKELKAAFGSLGVTATLPSSYWYLRGFDLKGLQSNVDWFNFMSYDIHGTWDGASPYTSKTIAPHTNLTEISDGLDLLWRNGISADKVVLGLGFYGRSFTLKDPSCKTPGCAFSGGAKPGECTGEAGILSNNEIQRILAANKITPTLDSKAGVKYFSWNNDQWVSYDDSETFKMKLQFANSLCLAGTMAWAIYLDTTGRSTYDLQNGGADGTNGAQFFQKKSAVNMQNTVQAQAFWTRCINDGAKDRVCPYGYHEIAVGHGSVYDAEHFKVQEGCHGKQNRLLCLNNLIIENKCGWNRDLDGSETDIAEYPDEETETEEDSPKRKKEKRANGTGSGGCNNLNYPLNIVTHIFLACHFAIYDPNGGSGNGGSWGTGGQEILVQRDPRHTTVLNEQHRTCNGARYPQACHHYSSVASRNPIHSTIPCDPHLFNLFLPPFFQRDRYPQSWNGEHDEAWSKTWIQKSYFPADGGAYKAVACQRDEWPPFAIWRDRDYRPLFNNPTAGNNVYIRLLPGSENAGAPNRDGVLNFQNFCDPPALIPSETRTETNYFHQGVFVYRYETPHTTSTLKALVMQYESMPHDPADRAYLTANACWPRTLSLRLNNPGYALFHRDAYYRYTAYNIDPNIYNVPPSEDITRGVNPPTRRDLTGVPDFVENDGVIVVREINSTRLPTAEEMKTYLGFTKCESDDCRDEIKENKRRYDELTSEIYARTRIPRAEPSPVVLTDSSDTMATETATYDARSQQIGSYSPPKETMTAPTGAAIHLGKRGHNHFRKHVHGGH